MRECEWIEFKLNWWDPGGVGRYASALANSARLEDVSAGYVIWGVRNDGSIAGTKIDPPKQVVQQQPFEYWLKKRLAPKGHAVSFKTAEIDGKRLVALVTSAANEVPVRFDGIPYIRVGSATPPLSEHSDKETALLQILVRTDFESDAAKEHLRAEEVFELVDVGAALQLLQETPGTDSSAQLHQLQRWKLVERETASAFTITNLGAILFARDLSEFGPAYERKSPRVIFYAGDNRLRTNFEQTGKRGYATAFEGVVSYLEHFLPRNEQLEGVLRTEHPMYPLVALRELIANSFVHQDFGIRGAGPMIEAFDHRIEISNPGTPLVDVDRLMDEAPRSRNESTARLMRHIGYCEERGSGIDKVVGAAEVFQLPPPDFAVKARSFVATLYAPRKYAEMTPDERARACYQHACLMWVSGGQPMTNATLRKRFGLDTGRAGTISRIISDALERGLVKPADPRNQSRAQAAYRPYWA
jgi:ATP-dependent DNA helicase RecG